MNARRNLHRLPLCRRQSCHIKHQQRQLRANAFVSVRCRSFGFVEKLTEPCTDCRIVCRVQNAIQVNLFDQLCEEQGIGADA